MGTMSATPAPSLPRRSGGTSPEQALEDVVTWAEARGTPLYPHQEEAAVELAGGAHVVLATPTGSGKSLVAVAAIHAALARDEVSFYTAPIKALVSEKFFDLCAIFGADDVGMLTGDASVNPDAPIIVCTAEVLANLALREGRDADVGLVVMDEFHYYADPDRGWAWQVPLLELTRAQFLLMSATLGPVDRFVTDLERRTGRGVAVVDDAPRPVPLTFEWSLEPLDERLARLVEEKEAPVYVVHATQAAAAEHAASLQQHSFLTREEKDAIAQRIAGHRFATGFGKALSALLRRGIGVHHAGMLPRYRRLVEQLAQAGLLKVVCGTDTLGVGINVPIRTVLLVGLTKFDGSRHRVLRVREFMQIAGRAGRAGFDTRGHVVVQAPEHVIENERALAKIGDDPRRRKGYKRKKAPDGFVVWTEDTFDKLVAGTPEPLMSRMRITDAMILDVVSGPGDAVARLARLTRDNHEDRRGRTRLALRALRLGRSLLDSGVLRRLDEPDARGRTITTTVDLPRDFALNQPLASFAVAALDAIDPDSPDHALDVVSVVEAILEAPRQVLWAQQRAARGEAVARMKADGIEYEERMVLLEEVTHPQPLRELLEALYETYRETHPWLPVDGLGPKSVVREMWETGSTFTELVSRYDLQRSEGLVLRYLTDAYRTLSRTVPAAHRDEALEQLIEWLGETVRQVDSSLLDEWEALASGADPSAVAAAVSHHEAPRPPRPVTERGAVFETMVRNALWRRVGLAARDDVDGLAALDADRLRELDGVLDRDAWHEALGAYWDEHDEIRLDADARSARWVRIEREHPDPPSEEGRWWLLVQTLSDPADDHDWVLEAALDVNASDAAGEPVLVVTALRRL